MLRHLEVSKRGGHVLLEGERSLQTGVGVSDNVELSIVLDVVQDLGEHVGARSEVCAVDTSLDQRKVLSRANEVSKQFCLGVLVANQAVLLNRSRIVVTSSNQREG